MGEFLFIWPLRDRIRCKRVKIECVILMPSFNLEFGLFLHNPAILEYATEARLIKGNVRKVQT